MNCLGTVQEYYINKFRSYKWSQEMSPHYHTTRLRLKRIFERRRDILHNLKTVNGMPDANEYAEAVRRYVRARVAYRAIRGYY